MAPVLDEQIIKLHTADNGHVWYARGIEPPVNSELVVDAFLNSSVISGFGVTVRILGLPQNAELLSALYLRRHKNEVRAVEVAGPNVLHAMIELQDPATVLRRMRSVDISLAAGGWHTVSTHDYPTYAMLARMLRTNFVFDAPAKAYFQIHPARKAALFIGTLSEPETAKLLTTIVDPRWYVDRRSPDRSGKLELFLGLTPQVQARVSSATCILQRQREFRCANVLAAWKTKPVEEVDLHDPSNFLYRIYVAAKGGVRGDLRGSQAFIRYLRYSWLEVLNTRKGAHDGIFVPSMFFKTPAECLSYSEHMQKQEEQK
jgi:hypothetical protein